MVQFFLTKMFKNKIYKNLFSILILISVILFNTTNFSSAEISGEQIENTITKAKNWLKMNQNPDGSWGKEEVSIIDTFKSLEVLYRLNEIESKEYKQGIDWLNLSYPENNDYLAEKVVSLAEAGQDISYLMEFLASQINERDGGFGYQRDYEGEVIITAEVLKAITSSNYTDPGSDPAYTLKSVLDFLLLSQNSDGGWGFMRWDKKSSILPTLIVLDALWPHYGKMDKESKKVVDRALNWVKNKQMSNGEFENLTYTGLAYRVLKLYNVDFNYYEQGIEYILNSQNPDGSFGDIYTTASAIIGLSSFLINE